MGATREVPGQLKEIDMSKAPKQPPLYTPHGALAEYLEVTYPGISRDCTGYSFVRKSNGDLILTVNLIINTEKVEQKHDPEAAAKRLRTRNEVTFHASADSALAQTLRQATRNGGIKFADSENRA
jgi:hypothetical protein